MSCLRPRPGSLYVMVLTDNKKLGAITPIGGLALIGGEREARAFF
jgi:uncharacterized membrane protein YgdD (TMEM256/DUF423 family)